MRVLIIEDDKQLAKEMKTVWNGRALLLILPILALKERKRQA